MTATPDLTDLAGSLQLARKAYAQYMRDTLTSRGEEYSEAAIREVEDGLHDEKHGVRIALYAVGLALRNHLKEKDNG